MDLAAAATLPAVTPRSGVVLPRSGRRHCRSGVVPLAASSSAASFTSSSSAAAALIYAPTPQDRPLRTPHSGYHFDGTARPFFEGWYFKVSIPECRQSFCFMYSVENPLFRDGMSDLDKLVYGPRFTGVGAQILGADDKYICQFSEKSNNFWGRWIEWDGERFEFENAPSYSEKNWGGGFPRKWYWIQCNVFSGASGEVSLTAAGGLRKIGLGDTYESPSLIGIHYEGQFFEFVPWTGTVNWDIAPWGRWKMFGENKTHLVEIEATTTEPGTALRAPTVEAGLVPACKDTCYGDLRLQLWEKKYDGSKGEMILDATSNMAALEVGGGPWFNGWKGTTVVNEVVNNIVGTQIDVESLVPIPFLKPPGL